jgi:hypothetical protein
MQEHDGAGLARLKIMGRRDFFRAFSRRIFAHALASASLRRQVGAFTALLVCVSPRGLEHTARQQSRAVFAGPGHLLSAVSCCFCLRVRMPTTSDRVESCPRSTPWFKRLQGQCTFTWRIDSPSTTSTQPTTQAAEAIRLSTQSRTVRREPALSALVTRTLPFASSSFRCLFVATERHSPLQLQVSLWYVERGCQAPGGCGGWAWHGAGFCGAPLCPGHKDIISRLFPPSLLPPSPNKHNRKKRPPPHQSQEEA